MTSILGDIKLGDLPGQLHVCVNLLQERVSHLMCTIESEHPNESLYTFTGNLHNTRLTYPLTPNNVRPKGDERESVP